MAGPKNKKISQPSPGSSRFPSSEASSSRSRKSMNRHPSRAPSTHGPQNPGSRPVSSHPPSSSNIGSDSSDSYNRPSSSAYGGSANDRQNSKSHGVPQYDGPGSDPGAVAEWQKHAGGPPTEEMRSARPIDTNIRNLDLGGAAWGFIRGTPTLTKLPPKPPIANTGKEVKLTLNTFPVLELPKAIVWQYDVIVGNGAETRGKTARAWKTPTVEKKLGKNWLFDGARLAWSLTDLGNDEMRVVVDLDKEYGNVRKDKTPTEVSVVVRKAKKLGLGTLQNYLDGKCQFDESVLEAITFLDHLLREWPSREYTKIKRNFFSRPKDRFVLGDGVEAFHGVYASMRPVHSPSGSRLSVNVDVANGTFWTEAPLHLTAREIVRARDLDDLGHKLQPVTDQSGARKESMAFKNMRMFKKLRISVAYRNQVGGPAKYMVDKILNQSAVEHEMTWIDKRTKQESKGSVFDYFQKQYGLALQYRHYPLVKATKPNVVLPMELCKFAPNQRYIYKLNEQQTSQMIKFAVTPPEQRWRNVMFGFDMLNWKDDKYLKGFGLKIDSKPATVKAHVLPNPKVQFGSGPHNPGTSGRWDLRGKRFLAGNIKELKSWGVMVVDGRGAPDKAAVQRFIGQFTKIYTGHGGKIVNPNPVIIPSGANNDGGKMVEALWNATGNANQTRPQILMFILPFKEANLYNRIKKSCDCRYGVVSQCMQAAHVMKNQAQYISNVCMKFNGKLGGSTARAIGSRNNAQWGFFNKPTMIMGADVSHGPPGSIEIPSMACMTFSLNPMCTRYAAGVQVNGHRVEIITRSNIEEFMKPIITEWSSTVGSGKLPEQLIYFRDGVSEGQYLNLLDTEVSDIKAVLKELNPRVTPKLTVIVATKRHHLRFFPERGDRNASDKNGNALPGTIVQTGCVSPFEWEFYLCAHSAIKGTARPVAYYVLMDENGFAAADLQQMIYEHSYQYIRSTTPVSIHPAVYYAHLAAKRSVAHENKNAESGPQTMKKKTTTSDSKKEMELLKLLPMPESSRIKFDMWYI